MEQSVPYTKYINLTIDAKTFLGSEKYNILLEEARNKALARIRAEGLYAKYADCWILGFVRGYIEGYIEGYTWALQNIVKRMLAHGMTPELIAKLTDLSIEVILPFL